MEISLVLSVFTLVAFAYSYSVSNENARFDAEKEVIFNLYTQENPTEAQIVTYGDEASLLASNFRKDKPVKVFLHGWNGNVNSPISQKIKNAFLPLLDVNVILVDWSAGGSGEEPTVISNVPPTGQFVAAFVDWLSAYGLGNDAVHLIGVSIGSHVIGFAGRNAQKGKIAYLTACDPPKTFWQNSTEKINPGDGRYVEVIHSATFTHSLSEPTGHVDFYPNGGGEMPGCEGNADCSHLRAYEYLVYSIDNTYFMANECAGYEEIQAGQCANLSTLHLGGAAPKTGRSGVFYLETNADAPYYKE